MQTITVFDSNENYLGDAKSFGEARRMHVAALQEHGDAGLIERYAGVGTGADDFGRPLFDAED